jgi:two-component system response regulator MprA
MLAVRMIPQSPPAPAALPDAMDKLPAGGRPASPCAASTILLVDQDPAVREALRRVLAMERWNVVTAGSREEALERVLEHEPDLIITEPCTAFINGCGILINEEIGQPDLPVFIITAQSLQTKNAAMLYATEYFQKPLNLNLLLSAIRRHLEPGSSWPDERGLLESG